MRKINKSKIVYTSFSHINVQCIFNLDSFFRKDKLFIFVIVDSKSNYEIENSTSKKIIKKLCINP